MTDQELHDEVQRLRRDVDTLVRAVAQLIQFGGPPPSYQAMLNTEHAFLPGIVGSFADWTGRPRPDLVPEPTHRPIPRRPTEDTLPRGGRNPRIFCERYDSGTWVHGHPHDCPTWARR